MTDEHITPAAFKTLFIIQVELLEALEWLVRDGADQDDCAKARSNLERARAIVQSVVGLAAKHDAEVDRD